MEDLEIYSKSHSADAITKREIYAKIALLLSLRKFRSKDDLKGNCISYWQQFLNIQTTDDSFEQDGMNVLLNIDNRLTAQKMKRAVIHCPRLQLSQKMTILVLTEWRIPMMKTNLGLN